MNAIAAAAAAGQVHPVESDGVGFAVPTYADDDHGPLETEWTWEGRLPRGTVVLVAGWRQSAKGLLTCNIGAAVSNGALLPGESGDPARIAAGQSPKEPGDVIIVPAEDDPNEDMAWRLRAAGADGGPVSTPPRLPARPAPAPR